MKNVIDGSKGYKLAAVIYDPVIEPGLKVVREKTLAVSGVTGNDRVIDVCCGTGGQAEVYAEKAASVVGIDISEYMIARAKMKQRENLTFIQCSATEIPYEDSSFDCASSGYAFHEISEELRAGFLAEMIRVTKPGGSLVFVDFACIESGGFKPYYYHAIFHSIERVAGGDHYRHYRNWMKAGGLKGFLEKNRLTVEKNARMAGGNLSIVKIINTK